MRHRSHGEFTEPVDEDAVLMGQDPACLRSLLGIVMQGFVDEAARRGVPVHLLGGAEARLLLDVPEGPSVALSRVLESTALGAFDDLRSCALADVTNPGELWAVAELRLTGGRTATALLCHLPVRGAPAVLQA